MQLVKTRTADSMKTKQESWQTAVNPYRYTGRCGYYYDAETNLYLVCKRCYDADAGVFCQRDSAQDGLSDQPVAGMPTPAGR